MMRKIGKAVWKLGKIAGISAAVFFVISFTVYFFNLDMKLTAALEPWLEKWHDRVKRERRL